MKILFLESFFGGSHKDFALGFKAAFDHDVTLVTLPDRFWKWRMRGAALYFVGHVQDIQTYDLIIVTDMLDLTDFMALAGKDLPPIWLYFHENQLSYPLAAGEKRDFHLGFTNIVSALAADQVIFNSNFHLNAFFCDASALIKKMPDFQPVLIMEKIRHKTRVIYPGCRFEPGPIELEERDWACPLIIWNHRWEHDKNPEPFFKALARLKAKNIAFSLAVLGENFSKAPEVFDSVEQDFKEQLQVFGYVESRQQYLSWLKKGAIVVSTAVQENFGISIVEAVRYGCIPLLPNRLSYPEIMPDDLHSIVLYDNDQELETRLEEMVLNYSDYSALRQRLSRKMARYSWQNIIQQYRDCMFLPLQSFSPKYSG
ncbi:MAG: DUF3524 domain-containing protein [Pseudomonadota bacterium]